MAINSRASLDRSPKKNWVENAGGLPMYIRRIANHLNQEKGMDISRSIAVAVNVVKRMCGSGDLNFKGVQHVNPKSQAEACAAVAEWEKKKASARVNKSLIRGRKLTDQEYIDMIGVEEVLKAGFKPGQIRDFRGRWVNLPGTHEFKKVGVWEHSDGTHGLYKGGQRAPVKVFKSKAGAKGAMDRIIAQDAKKPPHKFSEAAKKRGVAANDAARNAVVQRNLAEGKASYAASRAKKPAKSVNPVGKDFRNMTNAEKIKAVEIMHGTGSVQHRAAQMFTPGVRAVSPRTSPAQQAAQLGKPKTRTKKPKTHLANRPNSSDPSQVYEITTNAKGQRTARKVDPHGTVAGAAAHAKKDQAVNIQIQALRTKLSRETSSEKAYLLTEKIKMLRKTLSTYVGKSAMSDAEFEKILGDADFQ